ncbi:MAG: hypothetical protein CMC76_12335 [Flavobacteriaceae bacterium]|nr:hypothetical protein [Flavobacteriaceae bacterium]|tara:strand:+ start:3443 stop:4087 length:645 start_codon:yes stop_codon:yes gene_type:complete
MKNIFIFFITALVFVKLSYAQNNEINHQDYKYFDENYNPISKSEFEKRKWKRGLLSIKGDSTNHKILSERESNGLIENRKYLDSLLTISTSKKIDSTKPLVIIYYPGKDKCNSSGKATRRSLRSWYNQMEKGISKIKESNILYIYKNTNGLYGRNDAYKEWIEDPEQTIENAFFKRHYPCSSFVVISEDGNFISHFGELIKDDIWNALEVLTKN